METNKLDKSIKEKFENRTFTPSASAWERLSVQLDEQPKQNKKGWFFYTSIAASILLLISIGFQLFSSKEEVKPIEEVVIKPIDKKIIDDKIEKFINEIPVEEALVKEDKTEPKPNNKTIVKKELITKKIEKTNQVENIKLLEKNSLKENAIAKIDDNISIIKDSSSLETKILKQNSNSTIKINADDLLYAVTHSPQEVKAYYAKYNVNREDVLKTIKNELEKSNLKINPETILAEVERSIDDDAFQNNFLKTLKRKVSDIASAIASRND